ncbi:hypothetical protein B5C34_13650 [Pacificimonas flava]|uniref:Methyltransferase domain-containing protein n=2 Tax=Pacificimonas TaxID=1960290 RepID=A0A219B999_9SPHN|nr:MULTISPECIES: class I SAM-dependent methyltransferase [Pacificimonas]MBZ6379869.1 class I SAM-dependent methyltransferase [Pacificimonas aurantium]OWV34399.1 hypothetical protein B5C34_13650 [Pacificimonas flava]
MWDERYSASGYAYGTEPNEFLVEEHGRLPEKGRILCLAEGEGRNAVYLARQGFWPVAVDQSAVGLEKAKKLAELHDVGLKTFQADLATYTHGKNCWDGVVSIFAHLPSEARAFVHEQVRAGLRPGGVFLLEAYRPAQLEAPGTGGPSDADMLPTLEELRAQFEGFTELLGREITRTVDEGEYHSGESAVVQFAVRKPDPKMN